MIAAFEHVGFKPVVKIGHADGQEQLKAEEFKKIFGAPSLGVISRIYRKGVKLFCDIQNVPRHLAELINKKAYSRVSAEIYWNYACDHSGKKYPRVFKALSFLGAEVPAITSLADLAALYEKNSGVLCYDSRRNEYKVYAMEKEYEMTVAEKDGKWCVYKDGKVVSEHGSKEEAMAAMKGGDKRDPKDIPVSFTDSKGEVHMTEAEIQAKFDAMKAELEKTYEKKTADAVAEAKASAESEKSKLADRIAELEKQNAQTVVLARTAKIEGRLDKMFADGKISPVEKAKLKSVFSALPEEAIHVYQNDKSEDVSEPVVETLWKIFEGRTSKIFTEMARQEREVKAYTGSAQDEVIRRANELCSKDEKMSITKAYSQIRKEDPELWNQYQLDVKGAN